MFDGRTEPVTRSSLRGPLCAARGGVSAAERRPSPTLPLKACGTAGTPGRSSVVKCCSRCARQKEAVYIYNSSKTSFYGTIKPNKNTRTRLSTQEQSQKTILATQRVSIQLLHTAQRRKARPNYREAPFVCAHAAGPRSLNYHCQATALSHSHHKLGYPMTSWI